MRTDALDEACRRGVAEGAFPGAVVLVGQGERVLCHRAYGHRSLVPERLPMTPDTVFDVSSLTKPLATAAAVMLLVRDGRIRLDDPVAAAAWPKALSRARWCWWGRASGSSATGRTAIGRWSPSGFP